MFAYRGRRVGLAEYDRLSALNAQHQRTFQAKKRKKRKKKGWMRNYKPRAGGKPRYRNHPSLKGYIDKDYHTRYMRLWRNRKRKSHASGLSQHQRAARRKAAAA